MDTTPIKFSELSQFDDNSSIVLVGCIFESDNQFIQVEDIMKEIGLIPFHAHVIGVRQIIGNVRGDRMEDDSLKCWLIRTTSCEFNPLIRLKYGNDFKWTSDFIHNFKSYYNL